MSRKATPAVKTIAERVAELIAEAPPITDEQREAVVRILGPVIRAQSAARADLLTGALDPPAACCDGRSRYCPTCGGGWDDGEPYRLCTYTCSHGKGCDQAEPRPWHTHRHSHIGVNNCTWTTLAATEHPNAECADTTKHHAHRWGTPTHWCTGELAT